MIVNDCPKGVRKVGPLTKFGFLGWPVFTKASNLELALQGGLRLHESTFWMQISTQIHQADHQLELNTFVTSSLLSISTHCDFAALTVCQLWTNHHECRIMGFIELVPTREAAQELQWVTPQTNTVLVWGKPLLTWGNYTILWTTPSWSSHRNITRTVRQDPHIIGTIQQQFISYGHINQLITVVTDQSNSRCACFPQTSHSPELAHEEHCLQLQNPMHPSSHHGDMRLTQKLHWKKSCNNELVSWVILKLYSCNH